MVGTLTARRRWNVVLAGAMLIWSIVGIVRDADAGSPRQDAPPLTVNAREQKVHLTLRAGAEGVNGGMNFNGAIRGARTLIVPVGWRVQVTLMNEDNALPHSVMVVPITDSIPNRVVAPAFDGAATEGAIDGTVVGDTASFAFTSDKAGNYWLFCAVPGHGRAGMYLRLTVSRTARLPQYQ